MDALYDGYGESALGGIRAGKQDPLFTQGNAYLRDELPEARLHQDGAGGMSRTSGLCRKVEVGATSADARIPVPWSPFPPALWHFRLLIVSQPASTDAPCPSRNCACQPSRLRRFRPPPVRRSSARISALRGALEHLAPGPWMERADTPDGVVTAVRRLPPVEARYAPFPDGLDPRLRAALERAA